MNRILIVEDEKLLNETISVFLSYHDFEVVSAYDGKCAISKTKEYNPDLILLDVILPTMYGYEVAKKIREFSDVPIIFLTSIEDEESRQKAFECGASEYLSKSIDLEHLLKVIHKFL